MRSLSLPLLLLCVACSGTPVAPARSEAFDADAAFETAEFFAVGLEAGAALEAGRAFLEAYEDPRTLSRRHAGLVAGPDLREWAYWAGVQNAGLEVLPRGTVRINTFSLAGIEGPLATLAVDALVEIRYRDEDGEIRETERRFMTPMIVGRLENGGWRVVDVVRDARPMSASIAILDPPAKGAVGPAVVEVASVFRFAAATLVNLRVANRGPSPIRVDEKGSIIVVDEEAGEAVALTASFTRPIPPGATVEGGLTFPTVALQAIPEGVSIRLEGASPVDVPVEFAPEPFVLPTPQSASNSGAGGSSGV